MNIPEIPWGGQAILLAAALYPVVAPEVAWAVVSQEPPIVATGRTIIPLTLAKRDDEQMLSHSLVNVEPPIMSISGGNATSDFEPSLDWRFGTPHMGGGPPPIDDGYPY